MIAAVQLALTLSLASASPPLVMVTGRTLCPTRAEVTARLGVRPSGGFTGGHLDVAELREDATSIEVTLRNPAGEVIGQRTLPRTFSCADLAEAIAVVIETWEIRVHSTLAREAAAPVRPGLGPSGATPRTPGVSDSARVARPVVDPAPPATVPVASAPIVAVRAFPGTTPSSSSSSFSPSRASPTFSASSEGSPPAPVPSVAVRPPSREEPSVHQAVASTARVVTEAPAPGPSIEFLAGALGGIAQSTAGTRTSLALGARIGLGWTWARLGAPIKFGSGRGLWPDSWGVELGFLATSERSTVLPSGTAGWRRDVLVVGPHLRWNLGPGLLTMELHAEALGARLTLRGSGFASNGGGRSFDPGFGAGARLLFGRARVRAWVELRVADWVVSRVVYEQPGGQSEVLPRGEGMMAVGVSWLIRP